MKIGGVRLFSLAICLGSITTMLIPIAARKSLTLLLIARFLTGVFHGPVLPSLGSIWGHWAPVSERSRLIGIAMSGLQIGNIISMPVIGYMCVSEVLSWTSVFYLFGLIGLVWSASFFFCMSDSPLTQRFISSREKIYIAKSNNTALKTPVN
jgi:MFS family permease